MIRGYAVIERTAAPTKDSTGRRIADRLILGLGNVPFDTLAEARVYAGNLADHFRDFEYGPVMLVDVA